MITVKELITRLKMVPQQFQQLPVIDDYTFIDGNLKIIEDFPLGDPCRPGGCDEIQVVQIT